MTRPRLRTCTTVGAMVTPTPGGGVSPWLAAIAGTTMNWTSGAGSPAGGPDEPAGLGDVRGQRPAVAGEPAQRVARRLGRVQVGGAPGEPADRHVRVVLQALPHAGQVDGDGDAVLAQLRGRADAGQQQQLRAVHRAAGQHHLPLGPDGHLVAAVPVDHAGGPAPVDHDPGDRRVGQHGQVGPAQRRPQVRVRGRPAPPAALGDLVAAGAVLAGAVEVVVGRQARPTAAEPRKASVSSCTWRRSSTRSGPPVPW